MMLGTADPQGSLLGVDSLLAKLFAGDENSFYARMRISPLVMPAVGVARRSRRLCS
jgi:hypothetical protein